MYFSLHLRRVIAFFTIIRFVQFAVDFFGVFDSPYCKNKVRLFSSPVF